MMYAEMYDDLIYETWIVDELDDAIIKCSNLTDEEIDEILDEHPEYSIRTLPINM